MFFYHPSFSWPPLDYHWWCVCLLFWHFLSDPHDYGSIYGQPAVICLTTSLAIKYGLCLVLQSMGQVSWDLLGHWMHHLDGLVQDSGNTSGPFYWHGLTLITVWISNYIRYQVWDEITYPFQNFNGGTVEVWELIINFNPYFILGMWSLIHGGIKVSKVGPSLLVMELLQSCTKPSICSTWWCEISGRQRNPTRYLKLLTLVAADDLAPLGTRTSAVVMADFRSHIYIITFLNDFVGHIT